MTMKMDASTEAHLRKAKYGVFNHSAVQICTWTKKSLHSEGVCYKQQFYGVDSHRCMEFSPAAALCENNCVFCWRPMEFMRFRQMKASEANEPKEIYERLLAERRQLLSGYPGDGKTDKRKHAEALAPSHFAISLSGEPTLYPKLPQLVRFLKSLKQTKSIFIVTNGQEPSALVKLARSPPTQLYISVNAPSKELFMKINRPARKDGWSRFLRSLDVMSKMKTRRVLRLTMIKGMNMDDRFLNDYVTIIRKAKPHFVEVKAYMFVGFSRSRLKIENMPRHGEIRSFAENLAAASGFEIVDEKRDSRIVLLSNPKLAKHLFI
ncbi:MAG: 4-demethylwyosine synthase TYW1 [Candidatus Aenigmarchaeota archaeon]|nr:4-demethylwyosine synthase TYW1 [Candidatus Aenigmarchaeota archaeon]